MVHRGELRVDGRYLHEIRRIQIANTVVDNKGYIFFSQGETKVRGALSRPSDRESITIDIQFATSARDEQPGEHWINDLKTVLINIFSMVISPEQQIHLDIIVDQDDGSLPAVIINLITLVLCYYGVPMEDMCVAITMGKGADLCLKEQQRDFSMLLACLINKKEIIYLKQEGRCHGSQVRDALRGGLECCNRLNEYFVNFLKTQCRIGQI